MFLTNHRPALRGLAPVRLAPLGLAIASSLLLAACVGSPNQTTTTDEGLPQLDQKTVIAVGNGPHGIALAGGTIINSNPKSGSISLIDPESETVVKTLEVGSPDSNSPTQAQATHDGLYAVTMDSKANLLRVVKGETRAIVSTVALGKKPGSKLVWADDITAYLAVGTTADANVIKITWPNGFEADAATESLTVSRPEASSFTAGFLAVGGGYLAVPNGADNAVSFVKLGESASPTTLQEGNGPGPVGISTADGGAVLLFGNKNSSTVVLYDLSAKQKLATLQVGSTPTDMVLRADGRFAYVTCNGSGEVAVIDVEGRKLHGMVKVGRGLADSPSKPVHIYAVAKPAEASGYRVTHEGHDEIAQQIWVGGDGDASVTVLDAETQKAIAVIKVGKGHHKMAFTAAKAFVSNLTDNTVSVIDRRAIR